jgi:hypothetical protein
MMVGVLVSALACVAFGQEGEGNDRRERWRGRDRGDRGRWMERMVERVAEDLGLDEAQREELDQHIAAHRQRMEGYRELRQELRTAREEQDDARTAALEAKLEEYGNPRDSIRQIFDDMEPSLSDDQYDRMMDMREQWRQRQEERNQAREERQRYREMIEELPEQLKMSDEQRESYERLVEQRREQRRSRMEQMRPLWREMREAWDSGDEARVEELRQKLGDMRPSMEQATAELLKQVEEQVLKDDQKPLLDEFRSQQGWTDGEMPAADARPGEPRTLDAREVLHAARRVRMERTQRHELRLLARETIKKQHDIRRSDKEGQAKLAAEVQKKIVDMLDAEQKSVFEKELKRAQSRRPSRMR